MPRKRNNPNQKSSQRSTVVRSKGTRSHQLKNSTFPRSQLTPNLPIHNSTAEEHDILVTPAWTCNSCKVNFNTEALFIKHNITSRRCSGKNRIFTCYNCYKSFASRGNLDKHLKHANNVQCNSAHYNKEYLNAHGSTLFMDIEYNDANNTNHYINSIHVRQQESFPHMSSYARANINIDMLNLNLSESEEETYVNLAIEDDSSIQSESLLCSDGDDHQVTASDTSMIERKEKIDVIRSITCFESDYIAALELEEILHKSGASLGLFDSVMSWARKNHEHIPTRAETFSRKKLYEASKAKLYGTESKSKGNKEMFVGSNEPKLIQLTLPSKRSVTVPIYSFKEHVCSLLSDHTVVTKENLIYTKVGNNQFHVDTFNNGHYGDVHQTEWWIATIRMVIKDPSTELLCPVIFYLDALVLDAYGKLSLEPLSFTLGIFKRHFRNQKQAYRTLGFIEDLDHLYGANHTTPLQKADDYHAILSVILEDFKKTQLEGGMEWDFVIDGITYRKKLIFEVMFVIGDCKGHDMICGRVASHTTKGLCRDCDCTLASSDDPFVRCSQLKQSDIQQMTQEELTNISFRKLKKNAFAQLSYGANIWGINRATPPEPLHLILLGICMILIESLYSELPANAIVKLDELVAKIASEYGRQSDRNMPDIRPFRSGLSKTSRLTAKQKYGRVFVIFLALNTEEFAMEITQTTYNTGSTGHKRNYTQSQYRRLLLIFQDVLLYYKWACKADQRRTDFMGEDGESKASQRLRMFLKDYHEAAPRHKGLKLKLTKLHQTIHWALVIPYYGSGLNMDSGRGESIAGPNAKDHGKHTQKRAVTLNQQTAMRLHEQQMFDEARLHCGVVPDDIDFMDEEDLTDLELMNREDMINERNNNRVSGTPGGSRFRIELKYTPEDEMDTNDISLKWLSKTGSTKKFKKSILSTVVRRLIEINKTRIDSLIVAVDGFTELYKHFEDDNDRKVTFRSHPGYYDGREWHDWAIVRWDSGDDLEAKLQMFLNFDTIKVIERTKEWVPPPSTARTPFGTSINILDATPSGLHAVVSTVVDNPQEKSKTFMKTSIGNRLEIARNQQIIPTDSILGTAFVVEEGWYEETRLPKRIVSYLHVIKWGDLFLPEDWQSSNLNCHLNNPNVNQEANTISDEIINEENRATFMMETFDGFVEDYREES